MVLFGRFAVPTLGLLVVLLHLPAVRIHCRKTDLGLRMPLFCSSLERWQRILVTLRVVILLAPYVIRLDTGRSRLRSRYGGTFDFQIIFFTETLQVLPLLAFLVGVEACFFEFVIREGILHAPHNE